MKYVENDFIVDKDEFVEFLERYKNYYIDKFSNNEITEEELKNEISYGKNSPMFMIKWVYPLFSVDAAIKVLKDIRPTKMYVGQLFKYSER